MLSTYHGLMDEAYKIPLIFRCSSTLLDLFCDIILYPIEAAATQLLLMIGLLIAGVKTDATTGFQPCDALIDAGLGERLILATSDFYEPVVQSWWDYNARMRPWCFFLPQTTEELSRGVGSLRGLDQRIGNIAVRSGGHSRPGTNNVKDGLTIDLSMMNNSHYDASTNTARVATGARWKEVYRDLLDSANVVVGGGRDGGVGVGGYLLGGGMTFYSSRYGWACDSVVNYEAVLANGSVVNANPNQNSDLFKALRGGGPNFGIVSHFDLEAVPAVDLAYGESVIAMNHSDQVVNAVYDFANDTQGPSDDQIYTIFMHDTSILADGVITITRTNTAGNLNTTKFENITSIPVIDDTWMLKSMADAANDSQLPGGTQGLGTTLTFMNDLETINQTVVLHRRLVDQLSSTIGAENFTLFTILQPVSAWLASVGEKTGGNMLGLKPDPQTRMLWTSGLSIINGNESALAIARNELAAITAELKIFTEQAGTAVDLIHLNYVELTQDPLASYGADNVAFMKAVAKRYDPDDFFQLNVNGGFKISRVDV